MPEFLRKKIRLPSSNYVGQNWYFLTLCTEGRRGWFRESDVVSVVTAMLEESAQREGFELVAYCFMPDHLHILARGVRQESELSAFIKRFKQRTAYWFKCGRGQGLWQRYYYDHVLRPEEKWEEVAHYIWMNPVRKGLSAKAEGWPYSGSQVLDWRRIFSLGCEPWVPPWRRKTTACGRSVAL